MFIKHSTSELERIAFFAASVQYRLFHLTQDLRALRRAIALAERSVELSRVANKPSSHAVEILVTSLWHLYFLSKAEAELDRAIEIGLLAFNRLDNTALGELASLSATLINPVMSRYRLVQSGDDLRLAVRLASYLFREEPKTAVEIVHRVSVVSEVREAQYFTTGLIKHLDDAISIYERYAERTGVDLSRMYPLLSIAKIYALRFQNGGGSEDLDAALLISQKALERPASQSARLEAISTHARILRTRFDSFGQIRDIDDAITLLRERDDQTITTLDRGGAQAVYQDLCSCLRIRYEVTGDVEDLRSALKAGEKLLVTWPDMVTNAALSEVGSCYMRAGEVSEKIDFFDRGIELAKLAGERCERLGPNFSINYSNLANALFARYLQFEGATDLDAAIDAGATALSAMRVTDQNEGRYLINQAVRLATRYRTGRDDDGLSSAISMVQRAVSITPEGHSGLAGRLNILGNLLWEDTSQQGRFEEAVEIWRRCVLTPTDHVYVRFQATCRIAFAMGTRERWRESADAYLIAHGLLPELIPSGFDKQSRERLLGSVSAIPLDASVAAVRNGDIGAALKFFEEGRMTWWNQVSASKSDLESLRRVRPDLADRVDALVRERMVLSAADRLLQPESANVVSGTMSGTSIVYPRSQLAVSPGGQKNDEAGGANRGSDDLLAEISRLQELALELRQSGNVEEAIARYEEALVLVAEVNEPVLEGAILLNYGVALRRADRAGAGMQSYRRAAQLFRDEGESLWEAKALKNLGLAALQRDDNAQACVALRRASELFGNMGEPEHAVECLGDLGFCMIKTSPADAGKILLEAVGRFEELGLDYHAARVWFNLAECYDLLGMDDAAQNALSQHRRIGGG